MRNYKKEYENYHSRPEQKIRRAARNAARKRFSNADPTLDVHHKDNDPLNNDLNNLSLVTQHYNRKEPRLREKKLKDLKSKLTAALRQTENVKEGLTDPQELAKEIEWGVSPKNVDSRALSAKQKKQMKDIVKLMQRSKAPNWVSKFTQVYFTSDKLVQQRLKSAAKRGGMSPELMKKLFKEDVQEAAGFKAPFGRVTQADKDDAVDFLQHIKKNDPKTYKNLIKRLKLKEAELEESFDTDAKKMIGLMQKYINTTNKKQKVSLLKDINKLQLKLGLDVTEDMGTVTGPHIAGTGDDSSTVKVRKRKKVRRRKTESKSSRMTPSMRDWEDRNQLSKQIRQKFWQQFKKDKKKDVNVKFKLKNSKSLRKRIIDNVLAIQQKV